MMGRLDGFCWIWLTLLLGSRSVLAHDPNIATFELYQRGDTWILTTSFVLERARESLATVYPPQPGEEISSLELERRVVEYLRSSVDIWADGVGVPLGTGGIRPGEHQTNVRFILDVMPASPRQLKMNVRSFDDNPEQMQLVIVRWNGKRIQKFLSAENDFATVIQLTADSVQPTASPIVEDDPPGHGPIAALVLGSCAILALTLFRRRVRMAPDSAPPDDALN